MNCEDAADRDTQACFFLEFSDGSHFDTFVPLDVATGNAPTTISPMAQNKLIILDDHDGDSDGWIAVLDPVTR